LKIGFNTYSKNDEMEKAIDFFSLNSLNM